MSDHAQPQNPPGHVDDAKTPGAAVTADAFISYASRDTEIASALVEALERAGVTCWIAPRDVRAGALYAEAIVRAISGARAFVLVLSESSIGSSHVGKEIERASSKRRPIIALRIDSAPLSPALEYFLSESQWVEARAQTLPEAYPKLVDAILRPATAAATTPAARAGMQADTSPSVRSKSATSKMLVAAAAAIVIGYFAVDRYWSSRPPPPPASSAVVTPASPAVPATRAAVPTAEKSIAVLPFADMSEKKDQEYFSDGLSEDLIDLLTKVPGLHVPARTSSFYFKGQHATIPEIAKALSVTYVLEGSVRKAGSTVRVRTELIRADNGYNVWSETYDRDMKDIFKVQDEIAGRVVTALKAALPGGLRLDNADQRTSSTDAYNQYLLGQHFLDKFDEAGFRHAVDAFKQAIALDPKYAAAYAGLSNAENMLGDRLGDPTSAARGLAAAERAIALAPDDVGGYIARGWLRTATLFDWAGAAGDFAKAASIDADAGLAYRAGLAEAQGRLEDAISLYRRSVLRNPLAAVDWSSLARDLAVDGNFAEARSTVRRSLDIDPDLSVARMVLAEIDLLEGHAEQALLDTRGMKDRVWQLPTVAVVQHSLHHAGESQQALDELIRDYQQGAAYQIAEVYAWRGEADQAFSWLDRAVRQRDGGLCELKVDFFFRSLRADPRYAALLHKLKLPE